jgi:clorobiocin biosynthesis protein Clo-hal
MRYENASVVVIGGGPAGATTAILLKQARPDARIVLIERERFPRHHIGESTLPDANPVLNKLGVLAGLEAAGFVRKCGITYKWRNDRPIFSEDFAKGVMDGAIPDHSWQVDRSRYDAVILDQARAVGVEIWQPWSVTQVVREGDRVVGVVAAARENEGDPCTITCGHVVDCSGQVRLLGRLLGLANVEHELGDLAIYRYYDGAGWPVALVGTPEYSKIFFAATPAGWLWYIPLSNDLVSVGLVTRREFVRGRDLDEVFEEQLALVPELAPPLHDARVVAPPGSRDREAEGTNDADPKRRFTSTISNWSYQHASVAGPGWYLAGDAAAFVDPILSSGILLAHRAGLAAANAIRTEWDHPEIAPERLRAAYETFYSDLTRGFIVMARWWYDQRDAGIEDWWQKAAVLTRQVRAAAPLDDLGAFMHFVAGYITDFRFAHIGPSFGREGLAICVDGLTGQPGAGDPLYGRIADRRCAVQRRYDRAEVESYLATYVETDRWWDLPAIRFFQGDAVQTYRPPVQWDEAGAPDTASTLKMVEALLDSLDDQRAIDDVVRSARLRCGADASPRVRHMIHMMAADLLSLGLLAADGPVARVGSAAKPLGSRSSVVSRSFERAHVEWHDAGKRGRLPEVVFGSSGETSRYRPPFSVREDSSVDGETAARAVMALIAACDGATSVEDASQRAAQRLALSDARLGRDLMSVVLTDLVSIEALTLTP